MVTKVCATFYLKDSWGEETECTQVMNMCEEAYEYMTSKEVPEWSHRGEWLKMTPIKRLIKHLARIKESLQASKFTFEVFPD